MLPKSEAFAGMHIVGKNRLADADGSRAMLEYESMNQTG